MMISEIESLATMPQKVCERWFSTLNLGVAMYRILCNSCKHLEMLPRISRKIITIQTLILGTVMFSGLAYIMTLLW